MKPDMDLVPSPSQTVGPFFKIELTTDEHCISCIAGLQAKGERTWITFRVLDGEAVPVNDAMLEIWQADANGKYNHPDDAQPKKLDLGWIGFGRMATGEDGSCVLETIKPGAYPWFNHYNAWRPAHIHFSVFGAAFIARLVTQMYFPGDPLFAYDPIFQSIPDEAARQRLISRFDLETTQPQWAKGFKFDIVLRGPEATPFET